MAIKKAYTPSMSSEAIQALDRSRGMGNVAPGTNPKDPIRKQPWAVPSQSNPAWNINGQYEQEVGPENSSAAMSSESNGSVTAEDSTSSAVSEDAEEDTEMESPVKKSTQLLKSWLEKATPPGREEQVKELKKEPGIDNPWAVAWASYNKKKSVEKADFGMDEAGRPAVHTGQIPKPNMGPKPKFNLQHLGQAKQKLVGQGVKPISNLGMGKAVAEEDETPYDEAREGEHSEVLEHMDKALNSRSFHIPRPMGPYDPFAIQRSATTIYTDKLSKLPKPEGYAPLIRDTIQFVSEKPANLKNPSDEVEKCLVHGIAYKSQNGCYPCNMTKSMMCKNCGEPLVKQKGGYSACSKGH